MNHVEVLKECREALKAALSVGEIHFKTCVLSEQVNDQATAALAAIDSLPAAIGQTSDGYHTFDELYEHRVELWMALCRNRPCTFTWRSKVHSDGSSFDGWFVLGMNTVPGLQITYHLPISKWDECFFVNQTFEQASDMPVFDGHTSADILERLRSL